MGSDISWKFSRVKRSGVEQLLTSAPYFKSFEDPYFLYFSPQNYSKHPDIIVLIGEKEIEFTSFGDAKLLAELMDYLRPLLEEQFGAIEELY